MKFADYFIIITVVVCFIAALVYTHRRSKSGGCMGCGSGSGSSSNGGMNSCGGCSGCGVKNGCSECSSYGAEKRSQVNTP